MVVLVQVLVAVLGGVFCQGTVFDQRQTGKTNVRVEVKDAVIIAVGDGEFGGDYDYNYDYSDLTIKPSRPPHATSPSSVTSIKPTSPSALTGTTSTSTYKPSTTTQREPLSTANSANITQNAGVVLEAENNSIIFPSNKPSNSSSEPVKIPSSAYKPDQIPVLVVHGNRPNKFLPIKTVEKHYVPSSVLRAKISNGSGLNLEELPARHCSPGFFLDNHNRCKRIRRPARERPSQN